ncbi:TBC1 domain family member 31-like [Clavelina lepadiformis]|uniref:TBC1 domain family member 31-like n=1 Tax=Clavelina lepadiformis TaxID=159417 RepID=UPI004042A1A6
MQTRDITGQPSGKIWHRAPSPLPEKGVVVTVVNSGKGLKTGRHRRFLHSTFDFSGNKVITADHLGGIFVFDLAKNRYSQVQSCGQSCTAIVSGLKRKHEYLVGLADSSIKCYTTENKELVSWMRGHGSAVHSISVHSSGRFAITTSRDTAQLWNLDTFERIRKLNVRVEVPIQQVFYLPGTDTILTCFTDDSIFAWESDNFVGKFKLSLGDQLGIGYKAFAASRDGKTLVCGGKSNLLHLYSLESHKLTQVIKMPNEVVSVKQLLFLSDRFDAGANKVLGVLSQDGIARFVDIVSCRVLFELEPTIEGDKITNMSASAEGGDHLVANSEAGCFIIYSIKALYPELNMPPGPLVKVVKDVWKRKALTNKSQEKSQSTVNSSRNATRPLDGNMSTGRIKARRLQKEKDVTQEEGVLPNGLSFVKLQRILKWFGEYPEQYRLFIWRSILQVPENQAAFSSLTNKGTHIAYAAIEEKFPVKSGRLMRVLRSTLSVLAHWSAIFSELDYLPLIAFPFVKLFHNNHLLCFEMIATVLTNWCQHWFDFFPNPPVNILSMVENVLCHHDKKLLQHFIKCEVTTQIYAWPLLQTLMSEVLTRDEWLCLFDNVFSNHPSFLLYCVVAYSICCHSALMKATQKEDFQYFYHHRNAIDIKAVIHEAYRMAEGTPESIDPKKMMSGFEPLPVSDTYPIFNKYPKFIVDYQAQERERIRKDELEYLREKHVAQELAEQMQDRKLHEEAWYRRKEILEESEDQRRKLLVDEERKLVEQRKKLAAMKRELKVRELQLLDKARMRFVDHQQTMKQIEVNRLEEELRRKALLRDEEAAAAVENVEIKGLELEAHRAALEQQMARDHAELEDDVRAEIDRRRRLEQVEERMHDKMKEQEIDITKTKELESDLARAELRHNAINQRTAVTSRLLNGDIEREKNLARSLTRNIDHLRQQKHIHDRLKELKAEKDEELAESRERLRCLEMMRNDADSRRAKMLEDRSLEESKKRLEDSEKRVEAHIRRLREEHDHQKYDQSFTADSDRMTAVSNRMIIQDATDALDDTSQWSLDRDRGQLDEEERNLMEEVRNLRQRLVSSRGKSGLH